VRRAARSAEQSLAARSANADWREQREEAANARREGNRRPLFTIDDACDAEDKANEAWGKAAAAQYRLFDQTTAFAMRKAAVEAAEVQAAEEAGLVRRALAQERKARDAPPVVAPPFVLDEGFLRTLLAFVLLAFGQLIRCLVMQRLRARSKRCWWAWPATLRVTLRVAPAFMCSVVAHADASSARRQARLLAQADAARSDAKREARRVWDAHYEAVEYFQTQPLQPGGSATLHAALRHVVKRCNAAAGAAARARACVLRLMAEETAQAAKDAADKLAFRIRWEKHVSRCRMLGLDADKEEEEVEAEAAEEEANRGSTATPAFATSGTASAAAPAAAVDDGSRSSAAPRQPACLLRCCAASPVGGGPPDAPAGPFVLRKPAGPAPPPPPAAAAAAAAALDPGAARRTELLRQAVALLAECDELLTSPGGGSAPSPRMLGRVNAWIMRAGGKLCLCGPGDAAMEEPPAAAGAAAAAPADAGDDGEPKCCDAAMVYVAMNKLSTLFATLAMDAGGDDDAAASDSESDDGDDSPAAGGAGGAGGGAAAAAADDSEATEEEGEEAPVAKKEKGAAAKTGRRDRLQPVLIPTPAVVPVRVNDPEMMLEDSEIADQAVLQPTDFDLDHGGCSCLHDARRDWADGLTAAATCVLPALYLRALLTLPFRRNFRALQSSTHDKRPAAEGERRALHTPVYEEHMRAFLSKNLRDSLLRVRGLRRRRLLLA